MLSFQHRSFDQDSPFEIDLQRLEIKKEQLNQFLHSAVRLKTIGCFEETIGCFSAAVKKNLILKFLTINRNRLKHMTLIKRKLIIRKNFETEIENK